jgi:hypothetical protein
VTVTDLEKRKKLFKEAKRRFKSGRRRRRKVPQPWPDGDYTKAPFATSKLTETQALKLLRDKLLECVAAGVALEGDPGGCIILLDEELKRQSQ